MFAITFVAAVLLLQVPSPSLCSGVQLETWGNAVMAGVPASTTTTAPLSASWTAAEQVQLSGDTGVYGIDRININIYIYIYSGV